MLSGSLNVFTITNIAGFSFSLSLRKILASMCVFPAPNSPIINPARGTEGSRRLFLMSCSISPETLRLSCCKSGIILSHGNGEYVEANGLFARSFSRIDSLSFMPSYHSSSCTMFIIEKIFQCKISRFCFLQLYNPFIAQFTNHVIKDIMRPC